MLRIKCEVKESSNPKMGLGLFTLQDIKHGELIWKFDDGFDLKFKESHLSFLHPEQADYIKKYAWREGNVIYLSIDNERFINHSRSANLVSSKSDTLVYAARDIQAGEELFIDYSTFDDDWRFYSSDYI